MSVKNFFNGFAAAAVFEWEMCRIFVDPCPPQGPCFSPLRMAVNGWRFARELDREERIAEICGACQLRNKREGCECTHVHTYEKCELLQKLV